MQRSFVFVVINCVLMAPSTESVAASDIVADGGEFNVDVSPADGRFAIDLLGDIWIVPQNGGAASILVDELFPAARPRWSPDSMAILYESRSPDGTRLSLINMANAERRQIPTNDIHSQDASWHPDGERIVYSSDRSTTGLDLWETDLPSGISWRISSHPGDETEPVWSKNGRHIAFIRHHQDRYSLVLRRYDEREIELVVSQSPLSSPSWRPDGSLMTFVRSNGESAQSLEMVILSDPVLVRPIATGEALSLSPVSWRNRRQMFYAAGGRIQSRGFEDRRSRPVHFRAMVDKPTPRAPRPISRKTIDLIDPPQERLVIRAARLFDGIWSGYRENMDVVVTAGRIETVESRRNWTDATVLDLGNATIIPGLIDTWSSLPESAAGGPALLSYGVTTVVSETAGLPFDPLLWEGNATPGPRVLPAKSVVADALPDESLNPYLVRITHGTADAQDVIATAAVWRDLGIPVVADNYSTAIAIGADLVIGTETVRNTESVSWISGLADSGTAGIARLLKSRQATTLFRGPDPGRRFSSTPRFMSEDDVVVAGSKPNRFGPGLGLHAELRALSAAGFSGEQVLHAAGKNAASVLGVDNQIGTITPGALADLVLVSGDPLANIDDALQIVAVIRNGRFYSLVSLIERAGTP